MSHLEEGLLHALLDGEIASDELPPIQAHLAGCTECRARLEQERRLLAEAEGLVEVLEAPTGAATLPPELKRSARPHWGRRLAWAASVLAAVGLGYVARGAGVARESRQTLANPTEQRTDSGVLAVSTPAIEPVPAPPAAVFAPRRRGANRAGPAPRDAATKPLAEPEEKGAAERLEKAVVTAATLADSAPGARAAQAVAAPAADRAAAPALGRLGEASGGFARLNAARQPLLAPPEPISLPDAVRRLGGSLRLVEGLVPLRLEAQGQSIRVVYALGQGELVLSQQLIDGRVVFQLIAPPGFPADSLARLRARVQE